MSRSRLPREALLIALFDACWCVGGIWVYGVPALGVSLLLRWLSFDVAWWAVPLALPLAWILFLIGAILCAGALRLVLPRPRKGTSTVFVGKPFAAFLAGPDNVAPWLVISGW